MTTKTREDAIETADKEMIMMIKNGDTISGYNIEKARVVFCQGSIENSWTFAPAKPEFEKGTFGKFDGGGGTEVYGILDYIRGNLYFNQQNICAEIFTPIYQTDPVEKLAFELACEIVGNRPCNQCPLEKANCGGHSTCSIPLKAYFLSKAKEELSK